MFTYTVQFEYRQANEATFRQHQGDFVAADPKHARKCVVEQLEKLGFVVGTVAVYGSEQLMLGSVLPKPFPPSGVQLRAVDVTRNEARHG